MTVSGLPCQVKLAQRVRHPAPVLDTCIFVGKSRDKITAKVVGSVPGIPGLASVWSVPSVVWATECTEEAATQ